MGQKRGITKNQNTFIEENRYASRAIFLIFYDWNYNGNCEEPLASQKIRNCVDLDVNPSTLGWWWRNGNPPGACSCKHK
jgi:hypothetical protein